MMKAEDLVTLAAAHGIDLKRVAGGSNPDKGPSVRRRRRSQAEIDESEGRPIYDTAAGRHTRSVRKPAWSHAELGQAADRVPRIPWLAAQYSWAGDRASYWELYGALHWEAQVLRDQFSWSWTEVGIGGKPRVYLADLAMLVLDEDAHARFFHAEPKLYPAYMGVEKPVWDHRLYERYDRLKMCYLGWIDTARILIQSRLSQREEEVLDEAS